MSSVMPLSPAAQEVYGIYEKINGFKDAAQEFAFPLHIYVGAAHHLLGNEPRHTLAGADPDKLAKYKTQMETLAKIVISRLGKQEVEYYVGEFNRRAAHFSEETLLPLQQAVKNVSEEALQLYTSPREHSLDAFWKTYHHAAHFITCAANLVSRQIAFSNIVVSAKHKEEAKGADKESVEALLSQAKAALKLDQAKTVIDPNEIKALEQHFLEEAAKL